MRLAATLNRGDMIDRMLRVTQQRPPAQLVCKTCGDRLEYRGDLDREWLWKWGFAVLGS